MTANGIVLRVIRKFPLLTRWAKSGLMKKIANPQKRESLNRWYDKLDWDAKAVFQNIFSKLYRESGSELLPGNWVVHFRGKEIRMPLSRENGWLDWDNAVSILGHDPDVKITYDNLLKGTQPVKSFFDIGANYGTHSLLFLSQGIHTVSFEPNYTISPKFEEICRINHLIPEVQHLALGDSEKTLQFQFPATETWLGRIVTGADQPRFAAKDLQTIEVKMVTLDSYVAEKNDFPDLIKIDTEGNEIYVLRGAKKLIESAKPLIIFESNTPQDRNQLWEYFNEVRYKVCALPFGEDSVNEIGSLEAFTARGDYNFMAVPADRINKQV